MQWSDLISALHMLGHHVVVMTTRQQLSNRVRLDGKTYPVYQVKTSPVCEYTEPTYDLLFTDYIGLFALRDSQHFALYKVHVYSPRVLTLSHPHTLTPSQCRIRVLDSFGTEPICELTRPSTGVAFTLVCVCVSSQLQDQGLSRRRNHGHVQQLEL